MTLKEIERLERLVKPSVEAKWRDLFAAAALQGMLQSAPLCDRTKINKRKWAKIAFEWADAMMKARS